MIRTKARPVGAFPPPLAIPTLSKHRSLIVKRFAAPIMTFAFVGLLVFSARAAEDATATVEANAKPSAKDALAYVQREDVVFAEIDGIGLLMDIFTPTGTPNGLAIVDVASGAWFSDRGKINDH